MITSEIPTVPIYSSLGVRIVLYYISWDKLVFVDHLEHSAVQVGCSLFVHEQASGCREFPEEWCYS